MFYTENITRSAAKPALVEGRYKITARQKNELTELAERTGVPVSALVRMALECFLPKTNNSGYTDKSIKAGYLNGNY